MGWLGEPGLDAAGRSVRLLAAIDQHAAAVREALGDPKEGPSLVSLAGYASGIRDALIEIGWRLARISEVDWATADWPTLRLLAICSLARAGGHA